MLLNLLFQLSSRPRAAKLLRHSLALLGGLLLAVHSTPLPAQSVSFASAQRTVGSGFHAPDGVVVDRSGNIIVADTGNNAVKEITAASGYTMVKTLSSGFSGPTGVAVDGSGNIFVADTDNGAVKEILAVGGFTTTVFSEGFHYIYSVAVDRNGNIFVPDISTGAVNEILAAGSYTTVEVLYSSFYGQVGLAVDRSDNVFVADTENNQVQETLAAGGYTTVSTLGTGFHQPVGMAVDGSGNVFVADTGNNAVKEILVPYTTVITLGSGFNSPHGVAADGSGNVFVADTLNNRIEELQLGTVNFGNANICPAGQATPVPCSQTVPLTYNITSSGTLGTPKALTMGAPNQDFTLASGSTCSGAVTAGTTCVVNVTFAPKFPGQRKGAVEIVGGNGNVLAITYVYGTGAAPQIAFSPAPQIPLGNVVSASDIAIDGSGNIFVANFGHGVEELVAANGYAPIYLPGNGLIYAVGIAIDGGGNLFVTSDYNGGVDEILAAGGYKTVIPLTGSLLGGVPLGLAVDGSGNVFVADNNDGVVKELLAADGYTTIKTLGVGDFLSPVAVAVDGNDNVFVADLVDGGSGTLNSVKEILASDGYTTVKTLGSGFTAPTHVAVDGLGNVFVSDDGSAVKEIVAATGYTEVLVVANDLASYGVYGIGVNSNGNVYISSEGGQVEEIQRTAPPIFNFFSTEVGSTSNDSPKSVVFENIGNAILTGRGALSDLVNFTFVPGSGTPPDCNPETLSLAPGAECNLNLDFTPQSAGPISAALTLSDNSLNAYPATQTIRLSGIGTFLSQTITFNPIPAQTAGTVISLAASASSGLAVSFASTTPAVCTVSKTTAILAVAGTCAIQATQPGNNSYAPAAPVAQSFNVGQPSGVAFGEGFAGAAQALRLNGGATVNGTTLELTDGGQQEARSAFFTAPVNIQAFATDFDFQMLDAAANGFAFVIQKQGLTALGGPGAGLGYGPEPNGTPASIAKSVAVKFDIYNNDGDGTDSTGIFLNGITPTVPATSLSSSGVVLSSGHVIHAHILYDGINLTLKLTDTTTGATATVSFAVNIPAVVGGNSAYIGFTGGTGGKTAVQNILDWTYTSTPTPAYSAGFTGQGLALNGGAVVDGTALQLTDGGTNESRSAYFAFPQNIQAFTTDFDFQEESAVADGFTFLIQNQGMTAVGSPGGGLGYGIEPGADTVAIGKSVAIKFDIYNDGGEGNDSTGLYLNGAAPTLPATNLSATGVILNSGDVIHAHIVYNGTTLALTLTDATTHATAVESYPVDIPSVVGGNTAYVGFTGGTGGKTAIQQIITWTFTNP